MSIRNRSRSNEFTFIPITFIRNHEVSSGAKLVWMSVASRRQAHEPDPLPKTISLETGLSELSILAAEAELNALSDELWQALGLPL